MSLRSLIYHNFWLKAISLVLAALIWMVIREPDLREGLLPFTTPGTEDFRVAVRVLVQPGDARIFKFSHDEVVMTLIGEAAVLRNLSVRDIKAYVDLTDLRQPADADHVVRAHVPSDIVVRDILPRAVKVEKVSP